MGQRQSRSTPSPAAAAVAATAAAAPSPPPPPPDPQTQCRLRQVELNQIRSDLNTKQQQVDTCDPQGAQTRKTQAILDANTAFLNEQRTRLNIAINTTNSNISINKNVKEAIDPLHTIGDESTKIKKELQDSNRKLIQGQRSQRRNFLDDTPQSGVGGLPGIRTTDDKIMLSFWLTLAVSVILVYITVLNLFEIQWELKTKITVGAAIFTAIFSTSYGLIVFYG